MPLEAGTQLGPYEVLSPIGAGGMGEVYKATDTRLDRTVAIKVLREHVASDPDLKQRFEREAKTISSLNHPHICTLYDVGEHAGTDFLVMEYLEGETLAARLTKGPLPTAQVLRYATEIADALDKAHRQGITHRDLKPGNIMLTTAGAKLLDFGLAKLRQPGTAGADGFSVAATQSEPLTGRGTILGTLQYMAPEQVEGKNADHRTDIFAFGALLYEMATGQRAFSGDSQASLIGAILKDDPPPMSTAQPVTPTRLDEIVQTCLAKDPDDRWQSAGDIGRQVTGIIASGALAGGLPTSHRSNLRVALPWTLAALAMGAAVASVLVSNATRSPEPLVRRFAIPPPASETAAVSSGLSDITISPDGGRVVYTASGDNPFELYVRPLDELVATRLEGPDGRVLGPFISPDNAWVGFYRNDDNTLNKVSILGGPPTLISELGTIMHGASWGADGTIFFGTISSSGLWRVSSDGGQPDPVTTLDASGGHVNHAWPHILPGGRAVLFTILTEGGVGKLPNRGAGAGDGHCEGPGARGHPSALLADRPHRLRCRWDVASRRLRPEQPGGYRLWSSDRPRRRDHQVEWGG